MAALDSQNVRADISSGNAVACIDPTQSYADLPGDPGTGLSAPGGADGCAHVGRAGEATHFSNAVIDISESPPAVMG
jgi:hypothetical protein